MGDTNNESAGLRGQLYPELIAWYLQSWSFNPSDNISDMVKQWQRDDLPNADDLTAIFDDYEALHTKQVKALREGKLAVSGIGDIDHLNGDFTFAQRTLLSALRRQYIGQHYDVSVEPDERPLVRDAMEDAAGDLEQHTRTQDARLQLFCDKYTGAGWLEALLNGEDAPSSN